MKERPTKNTVYVVKTENRNMYTSDIMPDEWINKWVDNQPIKVGIIYDKDHVSHEEYLKIDKIYMIRGVMKKPEICFRYKNHTYKAGPQWFGLPKIIPIPRR